MTNQQQLEEQASQDYMSLTKWAEALASRRGQVIPHDQAVEWYSGLAQRAERFSRACRAVAEYAAERAQ